MLNDVGGAGLAGPPSPPAGFTGVALVGRGSQGWVFRATKISIGKVVALKAFPLGPADTARERALRAELQALVALSQHPGVVDVHDVHVAGGWAWLEMDYCGGGSAATWVTRPRDQIGGLPEKVVALLRIGRQVAEALGFAHRQSWVHGDVKPSNILFDARGDARLCDFGLARLATDAGIRKAVETGFRAPGTPRFQPPEVVAGAVPTAAGDVYALAETLRDLRRSLVPDDVVAAAGTRNPDVTDTGEPGTGCPDVLADLDVLLNRMSESDPRLRPRADDVAERLAILAARLEADEPSTVTAVTQREPSARSSGRHAAGTRRRGSARGRVTMATAATVAAALVLLVGASFLHRNKSDPVDAAGHPTAAPTAIPPPATNQPVPSDTPSDTPTSGTRAPAVPAPPPGAADRVELGKKCVDSPVRRCVWINTNSTGEVYANAWVKGPSGSLEYRVKTNHIQLVYKNTLGGYFPVGEPNPDNDDWAEETKDFTDSGQSKTVSCDTIRNLLGGRAVYAQASFSWEDKNIPGSRVEEIQVSLPVVPC